MSSINNRTIKYHQQKAWAVQERQTWESHRLALYLPLSGHPVPSYSWNLKKTCSYFCISQLNKNIESYGTKLGKTQEPYHCESHPIIGSPPKNSSLISLTWSYVLAFARSWTISNGNVDYVVSFLRGKWIKMDGLRCRMKWKHVFLDYVKRKQKTLWQRNPPKHTYCSTLLKHWFSLADKYCYAAAVALSGSTF